MQRELRDRWVEALCSGRYRRGTGCLFGRDAQRHGQYCVLGVLGHLTGATHELLIRCSRLDELGEEHLLGPWGGGLFLRDDPSTHTTLQRKLVVLNDHANYSFRKLAAWIEANVPVEEPSESLGTEETEPVFIESEEEALA